MGICLITTRLCRFTTPHSSLSAHLPHYLSKNYFGGGASAGYLLAHVAGCTLRSRIPAHMFHKFYYNLVIRLMFFVLYWGTKK